jgi:C1A family cysteine protease
LYSTAGLNDRDIDDNGVHCPPPTDVKLTQGKENRTGGHAMLAVGYDPNKRLFLIQNSWGMEWSKSIKEEGKRTGRFWMPYEWFENKVNKHTYDFWVIKYSDKPFNPKSVVFNPAHWKYENLK